MPRGGVKQTRPKTGTDCNSITCRTLDPTDTWVILDPSKILHEPWIDRLVSEPEAEKRLSLSMEALMHLTGSPGVSQWFELAPGQFQCMRERGISDDSITPQVIELVADGKWDARLPQSIILVTRDAPHRLAWALSTPLPTEEALTSAEAFLFLVGVLHPPSHKAEVPGLLPDEPQD